MRKQSAVQADYLRRAAKLVTSADRLRKEILDRIVPYDQAAVDATAKAWFENRLDKNFLWRMDEMADYLKELAKRLPSSKG